MAFKIICSPEAVEHLAAVAKVTQVIVVEQID
jgi:hypothetical protein